MIAILVWREGGQTSCLSMATWEIVEGPCGGGMTLLDMMYIESDYLEDEDGKREEATHEERASRDT